MAVYAVAVFLVVVTLTFLYSFTLNNDHVIRISESLDVVAHSVYFDMRAQTNHSNATVILASVLKELMDSNIGCRVDTQIQLEPIAWPQEIALTYWISRHFKVTHVDMIIRCYDLKIHRNSFVSLLYEVNGTLWEAPVKTGVVIPGESPLNKGVMACVTGFGIVSHLDEWLTYQQTIGIKFIHINVHASFLKNIKTSAVLQKLIQDKYVKIMVWEQFLNKSQVYYYSQSLKYQDCIQRYQNIYKYMMIADFDEYFIPLARRKNISFYVNHLFKDSRTGSVILYVIVYKCLTNLSDESVALDGNRTKLVNFQKPEKFTGEVKSIHLVKAVQEVSVHGIHSLLHSYKLDKYYSTRWSKCHFVHIRENKIC